MPDGQVLEFSGVTKRFGPVTAVDGFTARVEPGRVTGFLGPNGAGKTTTLRILLGLVRGTSGTATIGGVPYAGLKHPLQSVGAVLEASSFHPGRSAANHLKVYAQAAGLPMSRVDEALALVGLADVAGRKIRGYSLGMRQRLGLAYALLGDPGVLVLDEPSNGLDPEGIRWMRGLLRELAAQGRTVLVSSHMLAEVQQTADALLIISAGRLVYQGGIEELADPSEFATIVDSDDRAGLTAALQAAGAEVEVLRTGLTVRHLDAASVGRIAAGAGIALTSLHRRGPALEEIFLDLVNGVRVHPSASGIAPAPGAEGPAVAPAVVAAAEQPPAEAEAEPSEAVAAAEPEPVEPSPVAPAPDESEPEPEPVQPEPVEPDADEVDPAGSGDAAAPASAAFSVASTGVIDIIPPAEEAKSEETGPVEAGEVASADERTDATPGDDTTTATEEWDSVEPPASAESDGAEPDAAAAPDDRPHAEDTASAEWDSVAPDGEPEHSDRPWEKYVKTDADHDADRFFAAFDDSSGGEAPGGEDGRTSDEEAAEGETTADDNVGADHREKGER